MRKILLVILSIILLNIPLASALAVPIGEPEKILNKDEVWYVGGGYSITPKVFDTVANKVTLTFRIDNNELDSTAVSLGDTYTYEDIFSTKVDSISNSSVKLKNSLIGASAILDTDSAPDMVRIYSIGGKKALSVGEVWEISGGYSLLVQSIDMRASPRQAWFTLRKNCVKVDDVVVAQGQYYNYSKYGTTIQAYFDTTFAGATSNMLQLKNTTVSSNIDVYYPSRTENWTCGPWFSCVNKNQTRVCVDYSNCDPAMNKPNETQKCNNPPTANAGPDQTSTTDILVILDGTASSDPENMTLIYLWSQVSGPAMEFSNPVSLIATFTPPEPGEYVLNLTVRDDEGATSSDAITIYVENM